MTIKKASERQGKIEIDLRGPQGNAFYLLASAHDLCKQLDKDWIDVEKRMTLSNYNNLIKVFDEEFGEYVDLYQ